MSDVKEKTEIDGMVFDANSRLITDYDIYEIDLLPDNVNDIEEETYFKDTIAYIADGYFYLYRGIGNSADTKEKKPGIYKDKNPESTNHYFIIEPTSDEEKEEYSIINKINTIHHTSIVDMANNNEEILIAIPESTKIFQPQITENDDILKIIAKKALAAKNVDLDRYKDRFSNKNELFNFKQVLRSDNKLSMKIFTRGMEALNLVFTIIITEKSANNVVGNALTEPIRVSSEDTYEMSA